LIDDDELTIDDWLSAVSRTISRDPLTASADRVSPDSPIPQSPILNSILNDPIARSSISLP
jgi:hypothetical protein